MLALPSHTAGHALCWGTFGPAATTVHHRARLLKKLKLTNTFQLSRYAIEHSAPRLYQHHLPQSRRCRHRCRTPTDHTALSVRNGRVDHGTIHWIQKNHPIATQIKMIDVNMMKESWTNLKSAW
jgi:hypothetical protein